MPLSDFPVNLEIDTEIENGYRWVRKFISDREWERRKKEIEDHLGDAFKNDEPISQSLMEGTLLVIQRDQIGWYLYLVHTFLYEPHKYEYYQGARVLPIFKRLGVDLDLVQRVEGIDKKMRDLLRKRSSEADAILFEVLVALIWTRNGWKVRIIEEGKAGKTPDFSVSKGAKQWQVECKRQKKTSDYAYRETQKRQILISHASEILLRYNLLLNITFHVELSSLSDTYLRDLLSRLIPNLKDEGRLISNEKVDIHLAFVDIVAVKRHLSAYFVKFGSPLHFELIAGKAVDHFNFTSGLQGSYFFVGEGKANNLFVSDVTKAYGVFCTCDAAAALHAKARDVRSQLFDALKQFNPDSDSIIHIGMETFDGPEVEMARWQKIVKTMSEVDSSQNTLGWIYIHYFQSYARATREWYFDETRSIFTPFVFPDQPPLNHSFLIIPEDDLPIKDASHWELDLP